MSINDPLLDPCIRVEEFRRAYNALVMGGTIASVRIKGAGGEQETKFGKSDLKTLAAEINRADDECKAQSGQLVPRRRFAISFGYRPRLPTRF